MNLTESQMFTIEALNRIEGFVWPDGAGYASIDFDVRVVDFWVDKPVVSETLPVFENSSESVIEFEVLVRFKHPCWRNSLITREQFESVDGWVRDSGYPKRMDIEKVQLSSGGYKWRYHKPQKDDGMTLLEILVRELPRRGGLPDGANVAIHDYDKLSPLAPTVLFGDGDSIKNFGLFTVRKFENVDFSGCVRGEIVTRAEYEAAVSSKTVINAGEVEITLPGKVHQTEIKATVGMEEKSEAQKDLEDWSAKVMKAVDNGLIQDLYALNDAIGKEFNEKSEELNKLAKCKSEIVSAIKSWHKERGFDVSEVKLKFEPVVNVDVRLTDPSGKSVPWINHNEPNIASKEVRDKAPFGATHYDGEYGGCYLQCIGESWMMYVKGDWIKCDPDEQVLSRLMII